MNLQCEIVDHTRAPQLEAYVERLVEVRRKKNVTADMARDLLNDPNYFGTVRAFLLATPVAADQPVWWPFSSCPRSRPCICGALQDVACIAPHAC